MLSLRKIYIFSCNGLSSKHIVFDLTIAVNYNFCINNTIYVDLSIVIYSNILTDDAVRSNGNILP